MDGLSTNDFIGHTVELHSTHVTIIVILAFDKMLRDRYGYVYYRFKAMDAKDNRLYTFIVKEIKDYYDEEEDDIWDLYRSRGF